MDRNIKEYKFIIWRWLSYRILIIINTFSLPESNHTQGGDDSCWFRIGKFEGDEVERIKSFDNDAYGCSKRLVHNSLY